MESHHALDVDCLHVMDCFLDQTFPGGTSDQHVCHLHADFDRLSVCHERYLTPIELFHDYGPIYSRIDYSGFHGSDRINYDELSHDNWQGILGAATG